MKKQTVNLTPKPPRSLDELKALAQQLTYELGNSQYQAAVHQQEADKTIEALEALNREGAARVELDAKESK